MENCMRDNEKREVSKMLEEYIKQYAAAQKAKDEKELRRIENALRSVGMDRMMLNILTIEYEKNS